MVKVKAEYVNLQKVYKDGRKTDYFVYTNLEVVGHAENTGYTNNIKVCAGISACCNGIKRLVADLQYHLEIRKGYFHIWTEKRTELDILDKETAYAINTLVCQLYEIYCDYPRAFKTFDIIDVKENYDGTKIKSSKSKSPKSKPFRQRKQLDFPSSEEGEHY